MSSKRYCYLWFILSLFLLVSHAVAQPDTLWTRAHGTSSFELAEVSLKTDDGCLFTAGSRGWYYDEAQILLKKLDMSGYVLWTREYGGPLNEGIRDMICHPDGGLLILGETASYGAGGHDAYLIKTDADGNEEWSRTYGGAGEELPYAHLRIASDNGYLIGMVTDSYGAGGKDFYLVKTDDMGNVEWTQTYGGPFDDTMTDLVIADDGGYLLVGQTDSYTYGLLDGYVIKTNSAGAVEWTNHYGGTQNERFTEVIQNSDGSFMTIGQTESYGAGNWDLWVVKLDGTGTIIWSEEYGGALEDRGHHIESYYGNGYLLGGLSFSYGPGGSDC